MTDAVEKFHTRFVVTESGCWQWVKAKGYGTGPVVNYGSITVEPKRQILAHRFSYELHKGEIPEGLEIDHLCCRKGCVNPEHLEAVTGAENRRRANERGETCNKGHPFEPATTYINPRGYRQCIVCRHEYRRELVEVTCTNCNEARWVTRRHGQRRTPQCRSCVMVRRMAEARSR